MRNIWDFQSIYELQFFNCPACDYKDESKQEFVDHMCKIHPESINHLILNIQDGSLDDILCPWNKKDENTEIIDIDVKEEGFVNEEPTEDEEFVNEEMIEDDRFEEEEENFSSIKSEPVVKIYEHSNDKPPAVFNASNKYFKEITSELRKEKCNHCGLKFPHKEVLQKHISVVHGGISFEQSNDKPPSVITQGLARGCVELEGAKCSAWEDGNEQDFKCELCSVSFNTDKHLKIHIHFLHEKSENKLHCEICDITFKTTQKAIDHFEETHLGIINPSQAIENRTCKYCGKTFEARKRSDGREMARINLRQHIRTVHEKHEKPKKKPVSVKCDLCEKVFTTKEGLRNHKFVIHEGKRYECTICENEKFMTPETLKKHIRIVHDGILYQCETCGQILTTKKGLKDHVLTVHENVREYQCHICGKYSVSLERLRSHKFNAHGDKKYSCQVCGMAFPSKPRLKSHDDAIHKGLKKHTCHYCKEGFATSNAVKYHIISYHEQDKKIECNQCGRKFPKPKLLQQHITIVHEGIKRFKCISCNKLFGKSEPLKRHVQTVHEGLKPHKCDVCETAYGQKGDLNRHIKRAHTKPLS